MAERDVTAEDDKQADLDFAQGFESEPPPPAQPAQGEPAAEGPKAPDTKPITPAKDNEPAPPAPVVAPAAVAPEFVQLTKEEHASLTAAAAKTAGFEAKLAKAFGTIGNMQQIVNKLQSQTPSGEKVEVPKVAFAKLRESFPEVADLMEADMAETLKGLRGTGPDNAPGPVVDQEAVMTAAKSISTQLQIEALEDDHPTWREIVGTVDSEGKHDPNIPFRKWLATQPADYQTKINATTSAAVISKAIDKFQASQKAATTPATPPTPKATARKDRIEGAIQPRGDGGQPPPAKTADDDFAEGFRSG